jgi:hypothetical protein
VNATTFAVAVARTWVALYTAGLGRESREERRQEIISDLWEHQYLAERMREPVIRTAVHMLARTALGVPSDVNWRVEAGLQGHSNIKEPAMNQPWAIGGILCLAAAAVPVALGLAVIGGLGADGPLGRVAFGSLVLSTGVAMVTGLLLSQRMPVLGLSFLALGVVAISLMLFWLAFITLPLGIVLFTNAYARARGTGWSWPH